jgi:hypothetical protein
MENFVKFVNSVLGSEFRGIDKDNGDILITRNLAFILQFCCVLSSVGMKSNVGDSMARDKRNHRFKIKNLVILQSGEVATVNKILSDDFCQVLLEGENGRMTKIKSANLT